MVETKAGAFLCEISLFLFSPKCHRWRDFIKREQRRNSLFKNEKWSWERCAKKKKKPDPAHVTSFRTPKKTNGSFYFPKFTFAKSQMTDLLSVAPAPAVQDPSPAYLLSQSIRRKYILERYLTKGGFGTISVVRLHGDSQTYVLKKANTLEGMKFLKKEASILSKINHPHIIKVYDYFATKKENNLIMEHVKTSGDFYDYITSTSLSLGEKQTKFILCQMVNTLNYLYKNFKLVHRDIKLENFLIRSFTKSENFPILILIDFGFASLDKVKIDKKQKSRGSPAYAAPELWFPEKYEVKSHTPKDVWALGIMLFQMMEKCSPVSFTFPETLRRVGLKLERISSFASLEKLNWTCDLKDLYSKMVSLDPNQRITLDEILLHPWMKSI